MREIQLFSSVGAFAENKDVAQKLRTEEITPALEANQNIVLDFQGVEGTTQSFIHALISQLIRDQGPQVLDKISFKNCNETVRKIIGIVVDYMQES